MKILFKILTVFAFVASLDGKKFRCDYKYYKEANGWLKIHIIPANWYDAHLRCHLEGATLASPTQQLKSVMQRLMRSYNSPNFGIFTGIHSTISKGDYFSVEGIPLRDISHNWTQGEPDNAHDEEGCLVMLPDTSLSDEKCSNTFPYVCYKESGNDILNNCGTIDSEYTLNANTGSCYKFHRTSRTWSYAQMTCAAEGGHLAIINSEVEAKALKELYDKIPENTVIGTGYHDLAFLGFQLWNETGEWTTIHGQTLAQAGFDKFSPGDPNNYPPGEYCGGIFRSNGLLDDSWCHYKLPFFCEKKPNSLLCENDSD